MTISTYSIEVTDAVASVSAVVQDKLGRSYLASEVAMSSDVEVLAEAMTKAKEAAEILMNSELAMESAISVANQSMLDTVALEEE